jgi:hypothetical protein
MLSPSRSATATEVKWRKEGPPPPSPPHPYAVNHTTRRITRSNAIVFNGLPAAIISSFLLVMLHEV